MLVQSATHPGAEAGAEAQATRESDEKREAAGADREADLQRPPSTPARTREQPRSKGASADTPSGVDQSDSLMRGSVSEAVTSGCRRCGQHDLPHCHTEAGRGWASGARGTRVTRAARHPWGPACAAASSSRVT